jgi:phospholipase C
MIPTPTPALHASPRTRAFALAWALLGMLAGLSTWPAEAAPFAYITTNNNDHTVWVLDTATNAVAIIPLPHSAGSAGPNGVALAPDGKHAYVTNSAPSTVSVIETDSNRVVATVPMGNGPASIAITPDGKFAYITDSTSFNPGTVSVLDTATYAVATIPVARLCCVQIAITPDGKQAYVTNGHLNNTVSVVDTANKTVEATIQVENGPAGVAITPDGKHAYVTNYDSNTVSVIDTATHAVATVPVGSKPAGVAITPDGKHAYVTNYDSNTVSVIDTATHAVATVPVGSKPAGIAITPDWKYAYVANSNSDTVSVIDTATHAVATVPVARFPSNVATFASPVHHVIVVVGENRSFDHVFGVYKPLPGQAVSNLLSKGIVNEDGTPRVVVGENRSSDHVFGVYKPLPGQAVSNLLSKGIVNEDGTLSIARQYQTLPRTSYFISADQKTPYDHLPAPQLLGSPNAQSATQPPFLPSQLGFLATIEPNIATSALLLLTTGATGLSTIQGTDTRVLNAANLPNGPFQLTGPNLPYDAYTGNPTHRFYQMWQQSDCSVRNATVINPTGCLNDLYPFVGNTVPQTSEGGTSMAFLNMLNGDAPYLKTLADQYTLSDNHHQAQMGGTTVNHLYLAMADNVYFSDGQGHAITPPSAIANPNPQPGTNNRYIVDGLFSNCSDTAQPGVAPIVTYLASLSYQPNPNCEAGHYYLLNNLLPAYKPDGNPNNPAIPPTSVRSIGDALNAKGISWAYYGGGYQNWFSGNPLLQLLYCQACNPFEYQSSIMADPAQRAAHLKDTTDLFTDIAAGTLPAVSYVKPDGLISGEPVLSKVNLYEAFVKNLIERVQANPSLFATTAIFVTFDEGGGYYDSGFIQALDFFGDGPRVPFIAVSPWTKGGRVVHTYSDNASIVKFIERNWGLKPLTARSRDNLPNPRNSPDPYVPSNMPAIDDLFSMFQFSAPQ